MRMRHSTPCEATLIDITRNHDESFCISRRSSRRAPRLDKKDAARYVRSPFPGLRGALNNRRGASRAFSTRDRPAGRRSEPFGVPRVLNGPHSKEYPSSRGYGTVNRAITK
ncbi:hypothetical protein HN011_005744 [Eciton burchellii]|nr:hypothetical protein HN011_005744 [Eciton burchellii]